MKKSASPYISFLTGKMINLVVITTEIAQKMHNNLNLDGTGIQLGILHKKDQALIGFISLSNIDHIKQKCRIDGYIQDMDDSNLDYLVEANRLLIKHAFEQLNMRVVYTDDTEKQVPLYKELLGFSLGSLSESDIKKRMLLKRNLPTRSEEK